MKGIEAITAPDAVDVLSVLAEVGSFMASAHPQYETAEKLDAVHAAVAELMEKVEELLSTHGVYHCYGGSGESIEGRMHAELTAALARCGSQS